MIGGMLEEVETENLFMLEAQKEPHTIDDYTIQQVMDVYTEQQDVLWVYREQLSRWKQENPAPKQLKELTRLEQQVDEIDQYLTDILAIADEIKDKTIDRILGKSDTE